MTLDSRAMTQFVKNSLWAALEEADGDYDLAARRIGITADELEERMREVDEILSAYEEQDKKDAESRSA